MEAKLNNSMVGEGVRSKIGKALMGMAALGAATSPGGDMSETSTNLLGSAVLGGIGYALHKSDKKKGGAMEGMGMLSHAKIKKHKLNVPVHISDLGINPDKAKEVKNLIEKHIYNKSGDGIMKKLKKTRKKLSKVKQKAIKDTMEFLDGKKKVKPSQVALGLSTVLGTAAMIPSPISAELGIAATGSKVTGKLLKQTGRGTEEVMLAGEGLLLAGQEGYGLGVAGGKKKIKRKGTRQEVWEGMAAKTGGGLTKDDLMMNKKGELVSKKCHARGCKLRDMKLAKK